MLPLVALAHHLLRTLGLSAHIAHAVRHGVCATGTLVANS